MKIVISGSRHSTERKVIIKLCKKIKGANIYDCNQFPTEEIYNGKQGEIDDRIRNCDWYILVASTNVYGKYTFREWKVAMELLKTKHFEQVITVFRCENASESVARQNIEEPEADGKDYFTFDDFKKYQIDSGLGENFDRTYRYDREFNDLESVVDNELSLLMAKNWGIRLLSKPVEQMTATDVYSNTYRTQKIAGFNPDVYVRRKTVDDKIEESQFRFIIVSGEPASGKTRSIYEYLRKCHGKEKRLVTLTADNIASVASAITERDGWTWTPGIGEDKRHNLEHYYFVADQMNDMLWSDENIGYLNTIINLAVDKYKAHLLATVLPSNLQRLEDNPKWIENGISEKFEKIEIPPVSPDEAELFEKEFGTKTDSPTLFRQVIGEYIPGFSDYHTSIETHAKDYNRDHDGIVEYFVKAWNIVDTYRYFTTIPVGPVIRVLEELSGRTFETPEINRLLNVIKMNIDASGFSKKLPPAKHDAYFECDGENLRIPYHPNYILRIENDYIWNVLRNLYSFDFEKSDDARQAAEYFASAFFDDNPVETLRRILARTATSKRDRFYSTNSDQVRKMVIDSTKELAEDPGVWESDGNLLALLIAMCISRSADFQEFTNLYNEFARISGNRFGLTEETVAELYGFGTYKPLHIRAQIRKFLTEKGWNFDEFQPKGIYYPQRIILWESSFSIIEKYMENTVIPLLPGIDCNDPKNSSTINCLFNALIKKAESPEDVKTILGWSDTFKHIPGKEFFVTFMKVLSKPWLKEKKNNRITIELLLNHFLVRELPAVSKPLLIYYMIKIASCFETAQEVFEKHTDIIDSLPAIKGRVITAVLSSVDENDYGKVFAKYVLNDENRKMLNQANRNKLLSIFDFNDSIVLLHKLFDGKTPETTPDAYTIQAILTSHKKEDSVDNVRKNDKRFLYDCEPVFAIMDEPLFSNIFPDTKLISALFFRCKYRETEEYITDNFIRPKLKRHFAAKKGLNPDSPQVADIVDAWIESLNVEPEIVVARIGARKDLSFGQNKLYVNNAFLKLMESGKPFKSDLLNHLAYFIFMKLKNGGMAHEEFLQKRKEIKSLLRLRCPIINENRQQRTLEDLIQKDENFYFSWFRMFPEYACTDINATEFAPSDKLIEVLSRFDANKIATGILTGAFYILNKSQFEIFEKYFADSFPDLYLTYDFRKAIKEKYPDLRLHFNQESISRSPKRANFHSEWDFLNDIIEPFDIKFQGKETVYERFKTAAFPQELMDRILATMDEYGSKPSMEVTLKLIKCGMPAEMIVKYVETMFLSQREPLTSKVLSEFLEALQHRQNKQTKDEAYKVYNLLVDFENRNAGLIFPDVEAMLCRLALIPETEDKKKELNKIFLEKHFWGILNYRHIIRNCADLFDSGDDFVRLMNDDIKLYSLCSPQSTDVLDYAFFISTLSFFYISKNYRSSLSKDSYNTIYSLLEKRFDYDCRHGTVHDMSNNPLAKQLKWIDARKGFKQLLYDIKLNTGKNTKPFREYLDSPANN